MKQQLYITTSIFILAIACKPKPMGQSFVRTAEVPSSVEGIDGQLKVLMLPGDTPSLQTAITTELANPSSKYLISSDVKIDPQKSYAFAGYVVDSAGKTVAATQPGSGQQKCDVYQLAPGTDSPVKVPLFLCKSDGTVASASATDRNATITANIRNIIPYKAYKDTCIYNRMIEDEYVDTSNCVCTLPQGQQIATYGPIPNSGQSAMLKVGSSWFADTKEFFLITSVSGVCNGKTGWVTMDDLEIAK